MYGATRCDAEAGPNLVSSDERSRPMRALVAAGVSALIGIVVVSASVRAVEQHSATTLGRGAAARTALKTAAYEGEVLLYKRTLVRAHLSLSLSLSLSPTPRLGARAHERHARRSALSLSAVDAPRARLRVHA